MAALPNADVFVALRDAVAHRRGGGLPITRRQETESRDNNRSGAFFGRDLNKARGRRAREARASEKQAHRRLRPLFLGEPFIP